jgi:hypothetical protein
MAGVHPHLILKMIGQLGQPRDGATLAARLDQAFGPWAFELEDGKALSGAEALAWLLDRGDLCEIDGTLQLDPARRCGSHAPKPDGNSTG